MLHVELEIQYEDRLRKAIVYLVYKIDWPTFYEKLKKVINVWHELKENDDALKLTINKWRRRTKDITLLCFSIISLSYGYIEKTYDLTNDLLEFDDKRVVLPKRIISYLDKYKSINFELFPHAIDKKDKLKIRRNGPRN